MSKLSVLILGASYGLLPAMRIALAGHLVTVVCRTNEQSQIAANGAKLTFLKRDGTSDMAFTLPAQIGSAAPNSLALAGSTLDLAPFDMVFLAMTEPQFASDDVADLLKRIAKARLPVVSLMNALIPPFLDRIGTIDTAQLQPAYTAWSVWQHLDPHLVSAASPDAQAVRRDPTRLNAVTVTLGSNFKVAPFEHQNHQNMLTTLATDVAAYRHNDRPLPVRILAHDALHVPMAKWPMLIAGNCRCVGPDGAIISIADAVGQDPKRSRDIYNQTLGIVQAAGAEADATVPFAHYARAARALVHPSSFARAIAANAPNIERVDKIAQLTGRALGHDVPAIDQIVTLVDRLMARQATA